jgi:hypothetical protein
MAGTYLNFPYDPEVFNYSWKTTPDVILTTMLESGAVVQDAEIARLISNGSNFFTTPAYNVLTGVEDVYNGINSFTGAELTGYEYSGVVYGRMAKWSAKSFIKDFNSGADPMQQIVAGVAQYWQKQRQTRLIKLLDGIFGITTDADWNLHKTNLCTTGASVTDANKIGETTINDATVKANGDNNTEYTLAIMHSVVANRLANLQLLGYSKYTDASGITRSLPIGTINGKTVIINDNVPVVTSGSASGEKEYTTYVLGNGAIRFAEAPVDVPSEMDRDPNTNGGVDMIYTRIRECMTPYGFSFKGSVTADVGIPDATLHASASWERKLPAKALFMCQIKTNG